MPLLSQTAMVEEEKITVKSSNATIHNNLKVLANNTGNKNSVGGIDIEVIKD